ncbi:hypothetical protein Pmani_013166 [Petrolisthes manimaculis]|uniref:Uncharacterized protein n=1 Tax=Petrolisthes manimaculis TaxID=1843537 RepID=A0AAE1PVT1_9EUCA|nr:hypothetical protein Pmani_013166 [Petrolisthes manimaculis]
MAWTTILSRHLLVVLVVLVCVCGEVMSRPQTPETRDDTELIIQEVEVEQEVEEPFIPADLYGAQVGEILAFSSHFRVDSKKKKKPKSGPLASAFITGPELSLGGPQVNVAAPQLTVGGPAVTFNRPAQVVAAVPPQ